MGGKTNKSLAKRLRITKTGKIMVRRAGHNHFNAKASRHSQLARKRSNTITLSAKDLNRYLPNR